MSLKGVMVLFIFFFIAFGGFTQSIEKGITIRFKDIPLAQAIKKIENITIYSFFYDASKIDLSQKVSLSANKATIQKVAEDLFRTTDIQFEIQNTQIVLFKNDNKPCAFRKTIKVSGIVTSQAGEPVIGASVVLKCGTDGTITDKSGRFSVEVPSPSVLVVSSIGFLTQNVKVVREGDLTIKLEEHAKNLNEVMIVGYGTQNRVNLTGAVQQINFKQLENRSVSNIAQSLQGIIPNLNITQTSGQANAIPSINIRGMQSLSGGQPLIVIDGVPVTMSEFMAINTNDIATISTLMDASSSAIYGARAAFGVVLVTTKVGTKEGVQVTMNSDLSFRRPTFVPEFILDQNVAMRARIIATGGWYTLRDIYGIEDWDYLDKVTRGEAPQVLLNPEDPTKWLTAGRTNWYKEATKDGMARSHNVTISGINKLTTYYFSGNYSRQDGIFKYGNDLFSKYNFRGKIDFNLADWLTVSNNSYYNNDYYNSPSQGFDIYGMLNRSTLDVIKNPDGSWSASGAYVFGSAVDGGRTFTRNATYGTSFSAVASFCNKVLTLTAKSSFMRSNRGVQSYWIPVEYKTGPNVVEYLHPALDAQRVAYNGRQNVYDVFADLDKTIDRHHFHYLIGYNQEYRYSDWFKAYRNDLISSSAPSIQLATGEKDVGESVTDWSTRSGFSRFSYDYAGKYLFEINGRYDGTSRFPSSYRFGFFPSVSMGWNISKETFFAPFSRVVSMLKPRFSFGVLGNQDVGAYDYMPTMNTGKTSSILDDGEPAQQTTIYSPAIVANSLSWEKVHTRNVGIDFACFNNRLSGSVDYYERSVLDMLTKSKKLPNVLGASEPKQNAADLITKGWELALTWVDKFRLSGSMFNYRIRATLADSRAWITKYDNPQGDLKDYYVGYELGTIWGYQVNGLFQTTDELKNHANQSSLWTYPDKVPPGLGDIKFEDLNGDGQIKAANSVYDMQDQKKIGNSRPRYTVGINSSFDWKNLDFNFYVQGVLKQDWYPGTNNYSFWGLNVSPYTNLQKYLYENSWTPENTDAYMPRLKGYAASTWSGHEMTYPNTRYLQNCAYLRLKNVSIGYSLPATLISKIKLNQLRVFISGENLFTWTGIKNPYIDPEADTNGYPLQKQVSAGANIKF